MENEESVKQLIKHIVNTFLLPAVLTRMIVPCLRIFQWKIRSVQGSVIVQLFTS
jgi:hypothetical protein